MSTGPIEVGGETITPTAPEDGLTDQRVGFSAILYPQPIGFEAEWNFGQSPKLSSDFTTVGVGSIHGGYFLLNTKLNSPYGTWYPFVRWQYFDGARKFATNAPWDKVNEWDFGVEWLPVPEVEVALQYAYAPYRTNTSEAPYERTIDANWAGLQVQWNY